MRAAGFAEAPHERFVVGFQKHEPHVHVVPDLPVDGGKTAQSGTFAHVDHQRGAADGSGVAHEFRERGNQIDGKIVDGVIAEVFERAQHRTFAGAAHPGDDDEFGNAAPLQVMPRGRASARFAALLRLHALRPGIRLFPRDPLAVAPLLAHTQSLLFELTNSLVNGGEQIACRSLRRRVRGGGKAR